MLDCLDEWLDEISGDSRHPSGALKISAPAVLAQSGLVDLIARFAIDHSNAHLSIDFSEIERDIVGEWIDVAIRMGRVP